MKITKNSVENAILYTLIGGSLVVSPMGGKVVVGLALYYFKKWWDKDGPYMPPEKDPEQVRRSLYKLKRSEYIKWKYNKRQNIIRLDLTRKGRKFFEATQLNNLEITQPKKWDKQWRFFLFDIPEKSKTLRDILRSRLKNLGFFQFQKSVWVYPFECEKEMRYLCEYLGITPFTIMFTTKIDNDRILRRYFLREGILSRKHLSLVDKGVRY